MDFELISEEDFEKLPEDPIQKFMKLESICRNSMNSMINEDSKGTFDNTVRLQYMAIVSAAAEELGISGLFSPDVDTNYDQFGDFILRSNGIVTKLRLRQASLSKENSVGLANSTRGKIERQIQNLRNTVINSDISDIKKEYLLKKLDDFSKELSQNRISFGKVMGIIACISVGLSGTTGFLADVPEAITTISSLLGADKEAEEAEIQRLGSTPAKKALPAPMRHTTQTSQLDDEIPF